MKGAPEEGSMPNYYNLQFIIIRQAAGPAIGALPPVAAHRSSCQRFIAKLRAMTDVEQTWREMGSLTGAET